jgi:hypothetical protein
MRWRWRRRRHPDPDPHADPDTHASDGLHTARRRGADHSRRRARPRASDIRSAGAQPAVGDRGDRPRRQCARRLSYERRARNGDDGPCAQWRQHRRAECHLPGRGRRDRQGGDRRLSVERRQRLFDAHREPDRPGTFPARADDCWPRKRSLVRRAVQPAAVQRPVGALWRRGQCGADRPQTLATRPRRRSGRITALQKWRARGRHRGDGRRGLRQRPQYPRYRQ